MASAEKPPRTAGPRLQRRHPRAGRVPHASEVGVSAETLARIARLGGQLVVTVYGLD